MTLDEFAEQVRGRLIVSCQAPAGHPLRHTDTLTRLAIAAAAGGAAAIRCGGVGGTTDISAIAGQVRVPIVGLTKTGDAAVYITPTVEDALAVVEAGAHVVATDGTARPRPDGRTFEETVRAVHDAGGLIMADVASLEDARSAISAGADMVSTTLSGYTPTSPPLDGPDFELVREIRSAFPAVLLLAEGRVRSPQEAAGAISAGADSVVVGTAITDAVAITSGFVTALSACTADCSGRPE